MKRNLELFMGLLMVVVIALVANQVTWQASAKALKKEGYVVVVDAGHGGKDAG